MKRISTLDGWRGVAIVMVIAEHAGEYKHRHEWWAGLGSLGVDIFFVISGYIITARMIEERERSSTICLSAFYLRRAFRILPLLICFLGVLCLVSALLPLSVRPQEIAGALFLYRNYQYAADPVGVFTAHFWSLSIEEHFYLFWPLLFLCAGDKRATWIAAIGACSCALWRICDYTWPGGPISRFLPGDTTGLRGLRTDTRLDGLLLGCLLALLLTRPAVRTFIARNFPKETPLFCAALLFVNYEWTYGYVTITNYVLIAAMLASTLIVQEGIAWQWLNTRPIVWIGTISYSLYVWQQLFLMRQPNLDPDTLPLGPLSAFPYNVISAVLVAWGSFYWMELPLSRLGRSLAGQRDGLTVASNRNPEEQGAAT